MKLKSIRLHGFKSFPDSTRVEFHDGITAIVGPNGCGKSNIGDAIRWVLGEQRPTAIRGAKMEEAIFQGTASRKPLSRGAVSLVVTNEDGALALPYQEVEIGRVGYRDGGSDYRLNRASCRLRDIVDLCRDTGLGANAYSVIEIRMIDAILSERTDERRSLFEEAAGIGKYKARRRAALRQLETSEADLRRVEDVISEVATKVRSLARQKGKAQRHDRLRARRLALEVALARVDLEELEGMLARVGAALEADREQSAGMAAALAAAEADLERAGLEQVEAQKARAECAARLDAVAGELSRVEREVAVAEERIANGRRRLAQIAAERDAAARRGDRARDEAAGLGAMRDECRGSAAAAREDLAGRRAAAADVRDRYNAARAHVHELDERRREIARGVARLEGDRDGAGIQARELAGRLERLERDARRGAGALSEVDSQRDMFTDRVAAAARRAEETAREFEAAKRRLGLVRERLREARAEEMEAETGVSRLEAEVAALRRVAETSEGADAVVDAARAAFPAEVRGVLSSFVRVGGDLARSVDELLGRFGSALVVDGADEVERISRWHRDESGAAASLILLPLSAAPDPAGGMPSGVAAVGEGAPWVRALLGGAEPGARSSRDARGAVHLVAKDGVGGRLQRRARIESLEARGESARADLAEARAVRRGLEKEDARCEAEADAASERVLAARDEARAAEAEGAVQTDRRQRLARRQEELARRLEATRAARRAAAERERAAEKERSSLLAEERTLADRLDAERGAFDAVEAEWEQAREAESEKAILAARLESRLERLDGQVGDAEAAASRAAARLEDLAREEGTLAGELVEVRAGRRSGRDALEQLFARRDELRSRLSSQDGVLDAASSAVEEAGRRVRDGRRAEREAVGRRHQLELQEQDVRNRAARIGERLEAEWGRPVEALVAEAEPAEGAADELRGELGEVVRGLERIGPVNMLAVEEHAEESQRLEFLEQQRDDLSAARADLRAGIRRMNAAATELFEQSFEAIKENFASTFRRLFNGGRADLSLSDPDHPLESPIEIHAAPRGKRTQRIDLLSGGERALTALSLLFGIYLVKPSPFCVLDEVDAPLDESNIGRFIRLLQSFKAQTQFVVITHNPRTIEAADWIYGVTMEEPGVSSIVGVRLEQPEAAGAAT